MKALVIASCCIALLLPPAATAQQKMQKKRKSGKPARVKVEKLACRLGTEDEHARIAVQLANGRVDSFAYYSKWKPQTCSMDVKRGDSFSSWVDSGNRTLITLVDDTGTFLIDQGPGRYHFTFREIDRMRYCGMEGKVSGSLTIYKGRPQCELEGVLAKDGSEIAVQLAAERTLASASPALPGQGNPERVAQLEADMAESGELEIIEMGVGGTTAPPATEIHVTGIRQPETGQVAAGTPETAAGASARR